MAVSAPSGEKQLIRADQTMHDRVSQVVKNDLVGSIQSKVKSFFQIASGLPVGFQIGDIEDANVLVQNSLWLNVPIGKLDSFQQVISLQDRSKWAADRN